MHLRVIERAQGTGQRQGDAPRRQRTQASLPDTDILIFSMAQTMTIQVRGRGTLTLPATLREKYRLGEGDPLTIVDLDGAVLLSPRLLAVPRLAAEMERLRRARKLSLKDLGGPARED
jgi:bifunctional DNA-binding transcriptional regulator/antitoxin component of YhaV-PrlF toxin-antitoxin module